MKLDVSKLPFTKAYELTEEVVFDLEVYKCVFPLVSVLSCTASLKAQRFEEFIYLTLSLKAKVTLTCSYTLKNFDMTVKGVDELHFSPTKDEDEDCITYHGNIIELDSYIFNLLSASVPLSPKAPNAKCPQEVISDEQYFKEKEEKGNSQFDALKDLEFDE